MGIAERLDQDIVAAMKAREEHRLTTLRMVKSAIKNKEIEKRAALDEQETMAVLSTLIKQRKDSIEQFTKGGRQELADKEAAEIRMIEGYMPAAAGEDEVVAAIREVLKEMGAPTMKDMGTVMKRVMAHFQEKNARVEGKLVSDLVKRELSAGK
ncbi:MAG TPA: GatB/YqeY domain-containing protein [Prosthecobacter sp.]|nr:GatB/YqeY domain-containing protein [Prosthecobacter sp.]